MPTRKRTAMRIRTTRDIGAAVRGRRKDLGLSQADLAARAGVSRRWVYQLEAGKQTAALGLVLRVLDQIDIGLSLDSARKTPDSERAVDLDSLLRRYRKP